MTNLEQAQQLAGRHYYCEDCWYSCPKAEDGCCDKSQGTECNCGYEKRVQAIASALDAAEQRGEARLQHRIDQWAKAKLAVDAARPDFTREQMRALVAEESLLLALSSPPPGESVEPS